MGYCTGRKAPATQAPCAGKKDSPAWLGNGFYLLLQLWLVCDLAFDCAFDVLDFVFLAVVAMSNMLTCCSFPFAGDANAVLWDQ